MKRAEAISATDKRQSEETHQRPCRLDHKLESTMGSMPKRATIGTSMITNEATPVKEAMKSRIHSSEIRLAPQTKQAE